jgi:hypothetical protein
VEQLVNDLIAICGVHHSPVTREEMDAWVFDHENSLEANFVPGPRGDYQPLMVMRLVRFWETFDREGAEEVYKPIADNIFEDGPVRPSWTAYIRDSGIKERIFGEN